MVEKLRSKCCGANATYEPDRENAYTQADVFAGMVWYCAKCGKPCEVESKEGGEE